MSSHFRLGKFRLFPTNQAVSSTTVYTSNVVHILNLDNLFVQLNVGGTPTGAFSIQVSADHTQDQEGNVLVAGNWIEIVSIPVSGSALNIGEDFNQLGAPYMRIVYTNASSS